MVLTCFGKVDMFYKVLGAITIFCTTNYIVLSFLLLKAICHFFPVVGQKKMYGNECREDNLEIYKCFLDTHSSLEGRLRVLTIFTGYSCVKI